MNVETKTLKDAEHELTSRTRDIEDWFDQSLRSLPPYFSPMVHLECAISLGALRSNLMRIISLEHQAFLAEYVKRTRLRD